MEVGCDTMTFPTLALGSAVGFRDQISHPKGPLRSPGVKVEQRVVDPLGCGESVLAFAQSHHENLVLSIPAPVIIEPLPRSFENRRGTMERWQGQPRGRSEDAAETPVCK